MKSFLFAVALLAAALAAEPAWAHHSFAATYFADRTVTIEGKVVQFMFRNPHSFVQMQAPDDKGQSATWALEWGGSGQLSREGIERESLKPGDHVIAIGNPGRNPADHRMRLRAITRPSDGFHWSGEIQ